MHIGNTITLPPTITTRTNYYSLFMKLKRANRSQMRHPPNSKMPTITTIDTVHSKQYTQLFQSILEQQQSIRWLCSINAIVIIVIVPLESHNNSFSIRISLDSLLLSVIHWALMIKVLIEFQFVFGSITSIKILRFFKFIAHFVFSVVNDIPF